MISQRETGMSGRRIRGAVFLAVGLTLAACGSTRIVESWKAPGAGPLRFNKVLALALVKNDFIREVAEDALRADLRGVQSVPSYKVLSLEELGDRAQAKEKLRREGFDGVVALRLVGSRQELSWTVTDVPVDPFWGSIYGMPAELNAGSVVRVEINVYSLTEDKLIWAGVSETFNHEHTGQLVSAIVEAAGKELRRQGLIPA